MTRPSITPPLFLDPLPQTDELQRAAEQQAELDRAAAEARAQEKAEERRRNLAEFRLGEQKRAARAARAAANPKPRPLHPTPEDIAELAGLPLAELLEMIDDALTAYVTPAAPSPSKRAFAELLRAVRPHLEEHRG